MLIMAGGVSVDGGNRRIGFIMCFFVAGGVDKTDAASPLLNMNSGIFWCFDNCNFCGTFRRNSTPLKISDFLLLSSSSLSNALESNDYTLISLSIESFERK